MFKNNIKIQRPIQLGLSIILMTGLSACATTSVVKMTEAAPITYKIGQGGAQFASLTRPKASKPKAYNPMERLGSQNQNRHSYAKPAQPIIPRIPQNTGPKFDPNTVDKELYAHQKVGKRYSINGKSYTPKHNPNYDRSGLASWYGEKFHGKPTATGEIYNMNDITAAHKTLPLNSMVHVENLENGKTLIVRVNDRGPFIGERIIDLSKASAITLGTIENGLARVRVRYIGPADANIGGATAAIPPVFEEAPNLSVQAPSFDVVPYTSPEPALPQVPQDYFDVPREKSSELNAPPINPSRPIALPEAPMPEDDGQITLTIKGPIHIAKHESEKSKARLIKTVTE